MRSRSSKWSAAAAPAGDRTTRSSTPPVRVAEAELIEAELDPATSWYPLDWWRDTLLVQSSDGNLWTLDLSEAPATPRAIVATPFLEQLPAVSPNGRYLAFGSTESGRWEVYVVGLGDQGGKWKISNDGGGQPRWSKDGRELFYRTEDGLMLSRVDTETPSFRFERSELVLDASLLSGGPNGRASAGYTFPEYDVARDGGRFVMLRSEDPRTEEEAWIRLYTDWFSELRQLSRARGEVGDS